MNRLFQIPFSFLLGLTLILSATSDGIAQCGCQNQQVLYSQRMTLRTPLNCRPQMAMNSTRTYRVLRIYRVRRSPARPTNQTTYTPFIVAAPQVDLKTDLQQRSQPVPAVDFNRSVTQDETSDSIEMKSGVIELKQGIDRLVAAPEQKLALERRPPMLMIDQNQDSPQKDNSDLIFGITKEQCEAMNSGRTTTSICPATFLDTAGGWDNYSLECAVCTQGAPAAVIYSITDATWGYPAGTDVNLGADQECNCNCGHK